MSRENRSLVCIGGVRAATGGEGPGKRPAARATISRDGVTAADLTTWTTGSSCGKAGQISVRVFGPKISLVLHDDDDDDDDDD